MFERFLKTQKVFGKFDIVHGHDWHPVLALNLIKMDQAIPYVLTLHSTEWGRNGNNPGNAGISHREWLGGYESSRLIVTTRCMQDELKSVYSIPESKISIAPNGIVSGKVRKTLDPVQARKRYSINSLATVVLFCGRMCYQKGPDLLVEAVPYVLRERQDVRFIFMYDYVKSQAPQIVDARSMQEFGGGSILGAINIPYESMISNGRIKDEAKLKRIFATLSRDRPTVVYTGQPTKGSVA